MSTRDNLTRTWHRLEKRDQNALKILAIIMGILIIIYGCAIPAYNYYQGSKAEFREARELLAWMQINEAQARILPKQVQQGSTNNEPLLKVASQQAKVSGLTISRLQPEGDNKLRVWFTSVKYDLVINWLSSMASSTEFEQVSLEKGDKPGFINLQCLLIERH